jgi:hypothetical protein
MSGELDGFKLLPITSAATLKMCADLPDHDFMKTLFVASYPKSGTTWMQAIVFHILNEGKGLPMEHISDYSPFYEIDKTWQNMDYYARNHLNLGWRVFNTHFLFHMLPRGPSMKFIYVVRNGRDVVVSFYHHLKNQIGDAGNLEQSFPEFLDDWCNGKIVFGSWLAHLSNWIQACHSESSRVLLVHYEDMKTDLKGSLQRIARFLEVELADERIDYLASVLNFEGMKTKKELYQPISVEWKPGFDFLRKGTVETYVFRCKKRSLICLSSFLSDMEIDCTRSVFTVSTVSTVSTVLYSR